VYTYFCDSARKPLRPIVFFSIKKIILPILQQKLNITALVRLSQNIHHSFF
jgi:hypothetical protein